MEVRQRGTAGLVGRALVCGGALGVVLSLAAVVVGLRLLSGLDGALRDSIALTAEALDVVDRSLQATEGAVGSLTDALGSTEEAARQVATGVGDAVGVLDATADLTEGEIAASLQEVEDALPALIEVAEVIDTTLSALSNVGVDYDPDEPFDDSLRAIQRELDGLPEALRTQAELVREASSSLGGVRRATVTIADDLGRLELALRDTRDLMADYSSTAAGARAVVDRRAGDLDGDLRLARALVVALGLAMTVTSLAPLGVGWVLLQPGNDWPTTSTPPLGRADPTGTVER